MQNARVVLQAMQLRAGKVSRDQSMADNIKWILDQNPEGEDGGVGAQRSRRDRRLLVRDDGHRAAADVRAARWSSLAFAFNQGSFQAIPQGGGSAEELHRAARAMRHRSTRTLAAARLPLFALDLRGAPAWFREARGSRQIGAVYPEGDPYAFIADIVPASKRSTRCCSSIRRPRRGRTPAGRFTPKIVNLTK